ncbi:transglycosylase SLT domain-containing protein [Achromobacter sp. F4_2707]|uniref:lytic transglycosylase domain-containing protein n=1 Tax=Achromobacter sp. F4_2707 TaxID=3114286 RepID=UPI0039C5C38D
MIANSPMYRQTTAARQGYTISRKLGLALSACLLVLAGCSGSSAEPKAQLSEAIQEVDLRQTLVADASLVVKTPAPEPEPVRLIVPPEAREAVIQARAAMQAKQWDRLRSFIPQADRDPVLGSYVRYWALSQALQTPSQPIPEQEIQEFFERNQDAYLADRLKREWLIAAGRAGGYQQVLELAPVVVENAASRCTVLMAEHMSGRKVRPSDAVDAFEPNAACWSMLDQFYERRVMGWSDLQGMLRASLETNRHGNSRRLAAIMFDGAQMRDYSAIMDDPRKWLQNNSKPARNPASMELTAIALSRLAYGPQRVENAGWVEKNWQDALPKPYMEWVWSQFGLVAALNVELDAARWYRKSGNFRMTDYNHAWQVRAELRQPAIAWDQVAKAIRRMSARQAAEPVWVYWYARALSALGNEQAATDHYRSIAHDLSFYGLLASEELGQIQPLPPKPAPVTSAELAAARNHAGLQRAIALFELGWRPEAVPEWNFSLRGMDDRQLLAASELAREKHIYDRVVNTSLRTEKEIDLSQRFIAPFAGQVSAKANEISLDPAWVYGVIRQESRFITDARSRVGASGLMQLMPATAKWVARKIGMKDFHPSKVNDFEVNTILGTNYLRMVLSDLNGSEVLATAGYNAGPRRPVQWRSKLAAPVEGAIFAETIPFTETRIYVKNVMSNAIYYATLFTGQPHSLKERLGTVAPAENRKVALP